MDINGKPNHIEDYLVQLHTVPTLQFQQHRIVLKRVMAEQAQNFVAIHFLEIQRMEFFLPSKLSIRKLLLDFMSSKRVKKNASNFSWVP